MTRTCFAFDGTWMPATGWCVQVLRKTAWVAVTTRCKIYGKAECERIAAHAMLRHGKGGLVQSDVRMLRPDGSLFVEWRWCAIGGVHLTEDHIGAPVVFASDGGDKRGTIARYNRLWVTVTWASGLSQPCDPAHLRWEE